jgi:hypothetical protein
LLESIGILLSIACFNGFGVAVTKNASAAQRSTIDTSRTLVVWIFFLCIQGSYHESFHPLQLLGFALLVAGTLVYNEIVVIPYWGFDRYTKDALAKKKL